MNEIRTFENEQFGSIRTKMIDGEPWFVAKDVALALGYKNFRDAIKKHVDDEDKGVAKCDSLGGMQSLATINESGLYSLILSSKLPSAKDFKHWVTKEVLPSIRKYGAYFTDKTLDRVMENSSEAETLFKKLKAEKLKNKELEETVSALGDKADYYDEVLQSEKLIPMTVIAKDYGMSATRLNGILNAFRIQYKLRGTWCLYAPYQNMGLTKTKTMPVPHSETGKTFIIMYWTEKGRAFLYDFLKEQNIFPHSELIQP
jgi:prophage antirepressor-like protein